MGVGGVSPEGGTHGVRPDEACGGAQGVGGLVWGLVDVNHRGGTSGEMDLMITRFRSLTQGTSGNGAGYAKSEDRKKSQNNKIYLGCHSIFFLQM